MGGKPSIHNLEKHITHYVFIIPGGALRITLLRYYAG